MRASTESLKRQVSELQIELANSKASGAEEAARIADSADLQYLEGSCMLSESSTQLSFRE